MFLTTTCNAKKSLSMQLIVSFLVVICLSGCGYHVVGVPDSDRHIYGTTVWVDFPGNTTNSSSAQTVVRRALLDEFHAFRGMAAAASKEMSDVQVTGVVRSFSTRAISFTANDRIREYRLTLDVEFDVHRVGEKASIWKGILTATKDFPVINPNQPDLALQRNAEEMAFVAASRLLAQKLLITMEESY